MADDRSNDILAALQNGVQALNNIANTFPPITNISSIPPPAGTISYSSSLVVAFGAVRTSSGAVYRIPLLSGS